MNLTTNGGSLTTNRQGYFNNDGNVWYHTKSISNIIGLSNVNKKNHIIYDYENEDIFIVINKRTGGNGMIFTANKDGIYCNNMSNTEGVSMLSDVEEN